MPTDTELERQAFTINIDRDTYRRLKIQAVDERRSMSALIRDAVRNYLDLAAAGSK